MIFECFPTIALMIDLYEKPRTIDRFREYLKTLQGDSKDDLLVPITGFNPMAKEHVLEKLIELQKLKAEDIISETLLEINTDYKNKPPTAVFEVALNLSDDVKGGWTNRFTSDYDSKFRINAYVNRKFCLPVFWTSETYTENIIRERTLEYVYRTIYWINYPKPETLMQHVEQELYVAQNVKHQQINSVIDVQELNAFLRENGSSDNFHLIFNFFYGNDASASLGFPTSGIEEKMAGFEYVKHIRS